MKVITVERKILEKNDEVARQVRAALQQWRIFAINLLSSPGAGKTTILERTLERLKGRVPVAVIEGDVQTDLDAQRVARHGVPVAQIVTRGGCHLEARLVLDALEQLDLQGIRLLVIENVGNLVCPSGFDLGEALKVVVVSTAEGEDKPLKYPAAFRNASVLVINKTDLLPYVDCDLARLRGNALQVNSALRVFEVSAKTGAGLAEWCGWLEERSAAPAG